jgi:hypothetical protein
LLFVLGCAPGEAATDAGPSSDFPIELGSGRETFQALDDGATLYLERGFQGAQHVLSSVRIEGPASGRYLTTLDLVRDDGTQLSEPSSVSLPYAELDDGSGAELLGYRLVVGNDAVEDAIGRDAKVSVVVEVPDVGSAYDERRVHLEWAPDGWDPDAG